MEESNKAVEGEQPGSNENVQNKETTDPLKKKSTVARKALIRASEILGNRNSSKSSATSPARGRSSASTVSKKENNSDEKTANKKSAVVHKAEGEQITTLPSRTKSNSNQIKEGADSGKDLNTLKRKAEKAEKKVVKLKKKIKKAKKKVIKKGKLKILKDKLIKALVKLKRRNKKLKKASKQ